MRNRNKKRKKQNEMFALINHTAVERQHNPGSTETLKLRISDGRKFLFFGHIDVVFWTRNQKEE